MIFGGPLSEKSQKIRHGPVDTQGIHDIYIQIFQDMSSAGTETKTADADDDCIVIVDG